jgi:hypothetical protein
MSTIDSAKLLQFHSNVTVLSHNNENNCVLITMKTKVFHTTM